MSSDPSTIRPLQFETALSSAPAEADASHQGVTCIACQRTMLDEYFDVNGQSACKSCQEQIAQHAQTPREWGVFARACLFGFVAAILGAILYYAVVRITDFEIGIVAIAIGYMVGYGIRMATQGRGGRRFQVIALVLTYWAVGLAYTPLVFSELSKEKATQQASANTTASVDKADTSGPSSVPVALAILVGLSLALPVLTVVGSLPGGLLSAAIIGFGMRQAWQMTAAPQPQITGPYRIGAGPPALA